MEPVILGVEQICELVRLGKIKEKRTGRKNPHAVSRNKHRLKEKKKKEESAVTLLWLWTDLHQANSFIYTRM